MPSLPAEEALQKLLDGNRRYVEDTAERPRQTSEDRERAALGQAPFAVIVGCSDSRVPAEIVFDQGIGDLFVVRTAGHRIDSIVIASIEFAVRELGARLVMVLGHERCGAVKAALDLVDSGEADALRTSNRGDQGEWEANPTVHMPHLLVKLLDVVERSRGAEGDPLENAVRENVRTVVRKLTRASTILDQALREDGLKIVGAHYHLAKGEVDLVEQAGA